MFDYDNEQSKKKPSFFWVGALAPLFSVIVGSLLVFLTHAENHNIQVVNTSIIIHWLRK